MRFKKILQASSAVLQSLPCRINMLLLVCFSTSVIRDLSNKTFPVSCSFFSPGYSNVSLYLALSSLKTGRPFSRELPLPIKSHSPPLPAGICIYPVLVICPCISFPRYCLTWQHIHLTKQAGHSFIMKRFHQPSHTS